MGGRQRIIEAVLINLGSMLAVNHIFARNLSVVAEKRRPSSSGIQLTRRIEEEFDPVPVVAARQVVRRGHLEQFDILEWISARLMGRAQCGHNNKEDGERQGRPAEVNQG